MSYGKQIGIGVEARPGQESGTVDSCGAAGKTDGDVRRDDPKGEPDKAMHVQGNEGLEPSGTHGDKGEGIGEPAKRTEVGPRTG